MSRQPDPRPMSTAPVTRRTPGEGDPSSVVDTSITLRDGRRLQYLDLGAPNGFPVITCHGGLSSRWDAGPAHDAALAQGIRILSPDRPGVGGSDTAEGRTIASWPSDVVELADALDLDRFATLGWSLGAVYALACGAMLGDRVTKVSCVGAPIPCEWDDEGQHLNLPDRIIIALAQRWPTIDLGIFAMTRRRLEGGETSQVATACWPLTKVAS